jgi:hypothetical protein
MSALFAHPQGGKAVQYRKGSLIREPIESRPPALAFRTSFDGCGMLLPIAQFLSDLPAALIQVPETRHGQRRSIRLKAVDRLKPLADILRQQPSAVADHTGEGVACWLVETHLLLSVRVILFARNF